MLTCHSSVVCDVGVATGPRPMTSVKGAGYTSHGKKTGSAFDPFQQANSMTGTYVHIYDHVVCMG